MIKRSLIPECIDPKDGFRPHRWWIVVLGGHGLLHCFLCGHTEDMGTMRIQLKVEE